MAEKETKEQLEQQEIQRRYETILSAFRVEPKPEDKKRIEKAFNLAVKAHANMRRKSGEPYIYHPLEVARIVVADIGLGPTSVICALIHDVVEDTDYTLQDIEDMFGQMVARIVDGLTKIDDGAFEATEDTSMQVENFRKILLTLSDDVRVILIKLADRLHNMRTLDSMKGEKQLKIASETRNIYTPLAYRLGLYMIKTELEDLSLKYLEPETYKEIDNKLRETSAERNKFINDFIEPIREGLENKFLKFSISGRVKSVSSILKKMRKKGIAFEEVYDLFAIRIIVDSPIDKEKSDCYLCYSIVNDLYTPYPDNKRRRDWIATPKNNGYEALHTTVMSKEGKWVEVQIRSKRMDEIAERGIAAHWEYKNGGIIQKNSVLDRWLESVREMLSRADTSNAFDFLSDFRSNFFDEGIYVYTPKGDLKTLPKNATVLDFAFNIHTDIGLSAIGAKVNHALVPINHKLKNGDQVEIIYSKNQKPTEKWLEYVASSWAKSRIRDFLKDEYSKYYDDGEMKLRNIFENLSFPFNSKNLAIIQTALNISSKINLFYEVAQGKISEKDIKDIIVQKDEKKGNWFSSLFRSSANKDVSLKDAVQTQVEQRPETLVLGNEMKKITYKISTCCNAIPGDDVIGIYHPDKEIEVHRTNCPRAINLMLQFGDRIIKAKWKKDEKITFLTGLHISGIDRKGMIKDIMDVISEDKDMNIRTFNITAAEGEFDGTIMLYIYDTEHLSRLIGWLKRIDGVSGVVRVENRS
ncbi:MAG: RelA/SpoT family protein [Bacteroidales bacterium]|jgi:GTP pyrophosphokinase|nr:RelA/SpoT family protein [Bacteroidales bacterium]